MNFLGRSWKTTLLGILGAVIQIVLSDNPAGKQTLSSAAALLAVGAMAKDHDVTGGKLG